MCCLRAPQATEQATEAGQAAGQTAQAQGGAPSSGGPPPIRAYTVGQRVQRGPDWKWEDQDGGVGALGTVVEGEKVDGWAKVRPQSPRALGNGRARAWAGACGGGGRVCCARHLKRGSVPVV